jgi:hypothetical protein
MYDMYVSNVSCLIVDLHGVDGIVHDVNPAFPGGHLLMRISITGGPVYSNKENPEARYICVSRAVLVKCRYPLNQTLFRKARPKLGPWGTLGVKVCP